MEGSGDENAGSRAVKTTAQTAVATIETATLYVLKRTHSPAMLIEVAFVDDKDDAKLYQNVGVNAICKAIAEGVTGRLTTPSQKSGPAPVSDQSNGTGYKSGMVYTLKADALRVRTGAGTNFRAKGYQELSANARKHAYMNGTLKRGTKVTCQSIKIVGDNIWIRIPSG